MSSAPRVGSHYVMSVINASGRPAVKTHNHRLELDDYSKWTLIMLDRRDSFAAMMSQIITNHTKQFDSYPVICQDTVVVDCAAEGCELWYTYRTNRDYLAGHDFTRPYAKVLRMWFEDVIGRPHWICKRLNIQLSKTVAYSTKSPYNYRSMISNWEECRRCIRFYQRRDAECLQKTGEPYLPTRPHGGQHGQACH